MHFYRAANWPKALLIVSMMTFIVASCTPTTEEPAQVDIPPSSTFEMENFNAWPSDNGNRGGRQETKIAYGLSALTVGIWQAFTGLTMVLPVTAFKAAISQTPTYNEDRGAWHWSYTVGDTASATQLICDLYGTLSNEQINWEMNLTKTDAFSEFVWYTGVSRLDETSGSWTVYRDPEGTPRSFLQIDWDRDTTAGTGTIRYTDIDDTDGGDGNYIEAGRVDGATYDSYFTISGNDLLEIEWNKTTKEGRVRRNNGDWSCWDTDLEDIDCTE
ncbi:MAG: hypothetical protein AAFQ98_13070 [Bacteroidota bacterium]